MEDADLDLSKSKDYHEVAEVLRSFFAELVDPLLPFKLYDSFISIASMYKPPKKKDNQPQNLFSLSEHQVKELY